MTARSPASTAALPEGCFDWKTRVPVQFRSFEICFAALCRPPARHHRCGLYRPVIHSNFEFFEVSVVPALAFSSQRCGLRPPENSSMSTPPELTSLRAKVAAVNDPIFGRSLGQLKFLKAVEQTEHQFQIEVELPTPAYPEVQRKLLAERIQQAAQSLGGKPVDVKFSAVVRGKDAGGRVGLSVKNIIAVGSGKGGVGKSTVAACLAFGLQQFGAKVGLLDADVYGPSIPHMTGTSGAPGIVERTTPAGDLQQRMVPLERGDVQLMSMGFLIKPEQAVIWRGPMLHKALTQFLQQTEWSELDYLIIDLPPGTGDVSLTLSQLLGLSGAVVVCTPQKVAQIDAVKAIAMYRQLHIPLLGVVENMSGGVFGQGGARQMAEQYSTPFLGEVPIEASIREFGDEGRINALYTSDSSSREPLLAVCRNVALEVAREVLKPGGGPSLQIL